MFQEQQVSDAGLGRLLGQAGVQAAGEDPLSKLLREYRDAKLRYDIACQSATKAIQEREQASIGLSKLSEILTKTVQEGLYDPTAPPTPSVAINGNTYAKQFLG